MIVLAFLLMSQLLFAAEQPVYPLQVCSSSNTATSHDNNFFSSLHVRPTLDPLYLYHASNDGHHMPDVQTLLPVYCEVLKSVTNNEPIEKIRELLHDEHTVKLLYTINDDPVNNYMRRHTQSIIAYKYLQHKDLARAAIAFQNALGIAAEVDYIGPFGDPIHNAETALGANIVLQRMHPMYREHSDLAVLGGRTDAAREYMKREIAHKGPWTTYDADMIAWLAASYQGRANSFTLARQEYHEIAQRIEQLGVPELQETFLRTQFEASVLEPPRNPAYIDMTMQAYTQFLIKKNAQDVSEYFSVLRIAADHGHHQSALTLGRHLLCTALRDTSDQKPQLFKHAEEYLSKASKQTVDPVIADAAAFELAKIPAKNGQRSINEIEQFEKLLNRLGEQHTLAPRIHAHLAMHYSTALHACSKRSALLKKYKANLKLHTDHVTESNDFVAHNLIACKQMFEKISLDNPLTAKEIEKLDSMLAHSSKQPSAPSGKQADQIIAHFDHTISFESHEHAACALAMRGYAALVQEHNMTLYEQYILKAYALDSQQALVQESLKGYFDELFAQKQIDSVERILNEMDIHFHTPLNDFYRASVEEQRGNTERAIELYKAADLPGGWYSAGKIYQFGKGEGMMPDLDAALQCYERAAELNPHDIRITSAQAAVAGAQGRYQDQYDLLLKTQEILPEDAFAMAQLLMAGRLKQPELPEIYNYLVQASVLHEREKIVNNQETIDPETATLWQDLATCIRFQIDPATPPDIATLRTLGQSGLSEAYLALATQEAHKSNKTPNIQLKKLHTVVEKDYLERALALAPTSNRIKLRLANLIMPTEAWQRLDLAQASAEQSTQLMRVRALYQEMIASEEPSCFVTTAYVLYGNLLACVYKDYKRSEKYLRKGISLGETGAYLGLLKSYLLQNKFNEAESLLQEYGNFDWKFINAEQRKEFLSAEQDYKNLIKRRPQPEMPSAAASSSV